MKSPLIKNKKTSYIIVGALLLMNIVLSFLIKRGLYIDYATTVNYELAKYLNIIPTILLIFYCWLLKSKQIIGKSVYIAAFSCLIIISIKNAVVFCVCGHNSEGWIQYCVYHMDQVLDNIIPYILGAVVYVFFILLKFDKSKRVAAKNGWLLILFAAVNIYTRYYYSWKYGSWLYDGFGRLYRTCLSCLVVVLYAMALFYLWRLEGGKFFVKKVKKEVHSQYDSTMESLKQAFESGEITVEEYQEKRAEILKSL